MEAPCRRGRPVSSGRVCCAAAAPCAPHCWPPVAVPDHQADHVRDDADGDSEERLKGMENPPAANAWLSATATIAIVIDPWVSRPVIARWSDVWSKLRLDENIKKWDLASDEMRWYESKQDSPRRLSGTFDASLGAPCWFPTFQCLHAYLISPMSIIIMIIIKNVEA